jgi:ribonuclease HI
MGNMACTPQGDTRAGLSLSVYAFVNSFTADLSQVADGRSKKSVVAPTERQPTWTAPPGGVVKINVDAAVGKNTGCGSIAAVARDEVGRFMGASAVVLPGETHTETLEALACREGVALALDIDARRVQVASDCNNVVTSLTLGTMGAYAHIVQESKTSENSFKFLVFVYESMKSNKELIC